MKVVRPLVAALVIALAAACSSSPTAPDTQASLGVAGSGQSVAPGSAVRGVAGSGQ